MNLRAKILSADDIKKEIGVHVPEWDVTVDVWGMTGEQRTRAVTSSQDSEGKVDSGKLAVASIIETTRDPDTGELVFGPADRDSLMAKSGAALDFLATVGLRLSGMTADSKETIRKNSVTASDDSTSGSPKPSVTP